MLGIGGRGGMAGRAGRRRGVILISWWAGWWALPLRRSEALRGGLRVVVSGLEREGGQVSRCR